VTLSARQIFCLALKVTVPFIAQSIGRWQAALAGGHITWACFVARKPA